jgi:hypothetical protein
MLQNAAAIEMSISLLRLLRYCSHRDGGRLQIRIVCWGETMKARSYPGLVYEGTS